MVTHKLVIINILVFFQSRLFIDTHRAAASVATGVSRTLVNLELTAGTCVSRQTGARVAALAGVGTGGSIKTGLMVCTVVQIWKHQQETYINTPV